MLVLKKINNNVAICRDGNQRELIAFGKGIGFPATPYEIIQFTARQMLKAQDSLSYDTNANLTLTLTDHIAFAIERAQKGIYVRMPPVYEVEMNYPKEVEIGRQFVAAIKEELNVMLPKSEIQGIAMHLINACGNTLSGKNLSFSEEHFEEILQQTTDMIERELSVQVRQDTFYLRLTLKDESIVHDEEIKAIKGVAGVMKKAGQYQIVIGNDVANCYKEFVKLGKFDVPSGNAPAPKKGGNPISVILDAISRSMSPVIPAIIGAGMIQVLNIILGWFIPADGQTMQLMSVIGNTAFYFLPVLVAYSAGRKFGANPVLVTSVVAILIHPNFAALVGAEGGIRFLGIPVTSFDYSSSIIPAILAAWVMSYIERLVEKITPSFTKNFLKPMLIILISTPIAFLFLGPVDSFIGNGLASALVWIQAHASIAAYVIMAAAMPFIVMTGMHWAFIPVVFAALETPAGESLMLPAMLISNLAQGAACFAVALKSKNSNLKQLAASSGVSALFAGVTEPGLYGVTMPLKRPLAAVCISSGITGLVAGILGVAASSFASPSLLALPIFVHAEKADNFAMAVICAAVAIVLSFVVTWIMGFEDRASEE